jgi:hypothetical protein
MVRDGASPLLTMRVKTVANPARRANHLRVYGSASSPRIKNISLYRNSDLQYRFRRPGPLRDVSRSSRCVGPRCDGRGNPRRRAWSERAIAAAAGRRKAADGEVVWSWRRDRGVYPARLCGLGNGDKNRRSPGRARISRKTIARGKPGCPGCTCGSTRVLFCYRTFAHGTAGAVGARLSLRPLQRGGPTRLQNPGENPPREY